MSASSSGCQSSLTNKFLKFLFRIGSDLVTKDVIDIKYLLKENTLPKEILDKIEQGKDLLFHLQRQGKLSENNLDLLVELLDEVGLKKTVKKVKEYKENVNTVESVPRKLMDDILPALNSELIHLLLKGQQNTITATRIEEIKQAICTALDLKLSAISFVSADGLNSRYMYIDWTFQLKISEEKVQKLQVDAIQKQDWIVQLGVYELRVDDKSTFKILNVEGANGPTDDRHHAGMQPARPNYMPAKRNSVTNPSHSFHSNDQLDIILAIELPRSAKEATCKYLLNTCKSAIQSFSSSTQGVDLHSSINFSLVTYGNHFTSDNELEEVAFVEKKFSHDSDITTCLRRCYGTDGASGIADALEKVVGLDESNTMHREATKLCILISFIEEESFNLEHYRCTHGNDAIKMCNDLAENAVPLYIIGIHCPGKKAQAMMRSSFHDKEIDFLAGLSGISGGRYIQIGISDLGELIECIIKEDISIEENMGTVNDLVLSEIDKQYGFVHDTHLADHLKVELCLRNSKVNRIKSHGKPLSPISQIAERVSWAEDLDDAIDAVSDLTEKMLPHSSSMPNIRAAQGEGCESFPKSFHASQAFTTVREGVDFDISSRMVKRLIRRRACYRPTT